MRAYLNGVVCLFIALAAVWSVPAQAQTRAQNWERCTDKNKQFSPDEKIQACTAIIKSGKENKNDLSIAYNNRGIGYDSKGQFDTAIENFDEAIRINPNSALAHYNRGIAYTNRGNWYNSFDDRLRGLQDINKAMSLQKRE
jgi:tetratricopeptide (TPR) repeat protein